MSNHSLNTSHLSFSHSAKAFLRHWLLVVDEHSIHSPFFYDFYKRILHGKSEESIFKKMEDLRHQLLTNETLIHGPDPGAGSRTSTSAERLLSDITRNAVTPPELAAFYHRIIHEIKAERIVELGTGPGITTLYLAERKETNVFTFEGNHSLANVALTNFEFLEQRNIELIEGNLQTTLPDFLQDPAKIHFVLMDANHRYEATMRYFSWILRRLDEKSIVVVDDIHWSEEMEKAWTELRLHPLVYGSVDLFRCGLLFFEPSLNRQHYIWNLS